MVILHRTNSDCIQFLIPKLYIVSDFSDLLLTSHAVSFFYEGTETSGLALMFTLYELAKNQECQERLYVEICEKIERCGDQLTYEAFQEIEYLEWVVLEALRIHPTLMAMLKVCTEKYTLPRVSEDAEPLTIYPGTPIQIPILALHMCVLRNSRFYRITSFQDFLASFAGIRDISPSRRNLSRNVSLQRSRVNDTKESIYHSAKDHESVWECVSEWCR